MGFCLLKLRYDEVSETPNAGVVPNPSAAEGAEATAAVTPSPRRRATKRMKALLQADFLDWDPFAAPTEDSTNASSYGTPLHTADKVRKRLTSTRSGCKGKGNVNSEIELKAEVTTLALLPSPDIDVQRHGFSIDALHCHDVLCDADGCRRATLKGTGDAKVVKLVRDFRRHPRAGGDETRMAEIIVSQISPGRFFEEGADGKWYEAGTFPIVVVGASKKVFYCLLIHEF
jgi:hypothetical protein